MVLGNRFFKFIFIKAFGWFWETCFHIFHLATFSWARTNVGTRRARGQTAAIVRRGKNSMERLGSSLWWRYRCPVARLRRCEMPCFGILVCFWTFVRLLRQIMKRWHRFEDWATSKGFLLVAWPCCVNALSSSFSCKLVLLLCLFFEHILWMSCFCLVTGFQRSERSQGELGPRTADSKMI